MLEPGEEFLRSRLEFIRCFYLRGPELSGFKYLFKRGITKNRRVKARKGWGMMELTHKKLVGKEHRRKTRHAFTIRSRESLCESGTFAG